MINHVQQSEHAALVSILNRLEGMAKDDMTLAERHIASIAAKAINAEIEYDRHGEFEWSYAPAIGAGE